MKIINLILCGFMLTACATQSNVTPTPKQMANNNFLPKNPMSVALYTQGTKPKTPYKILGSEKVSKYNIVGIKRQEAHVREAMRTLAANLGGDAVIDIQHNDKNIIGTVIAFDSPTNNNDKG